MYGKTERKRTYYACERRPKRDVGKDWYDEHPPCIRIRDYLLDNAVHEFFATRIFGPDRQKLYVRTLHAADQEDQADRDRQRSEALRKQVGDLRVRQDRLLDELESPVIDAMDEDSRKDFRQRLHQRFADLGAQLRAKQAELEQLSSTPARGECDPSLLDHLPQLGRGLGDVPETLQRNLYDAFCLEIHYSHSKHEATLKVTITDEAAASVTETLESVPANESADPLCAPNGIRTRATALKGRRPRPLDDGGARNVRREKARGRV